MNIQDPISDLLTQLRNGYSAKKDFIIVHASKIKLEILKILKDESFLNDYAIIDADIKKAKLKIYLKYYGKKIPIIKKITRISKPSVRIYSKSKKIPKILNGFGLAIISTPIGLLTDKKARELKHGGEIICTIE
ncbi:MAG TPA: 30S ribosomal protein S8 [Candidatus Azoamicus sp. MARI]